MEEIKTEASWVLHPKSFSLIAPNQEVIKFTATESAIFLALVMAGGVLPLYQMIQRFGEIDASDDLNKVRFEKIMSRIRLKLRSYTHDATTIQSVYKQGYQLMLHVSVAN